MHPWANEGLVTNHGDERGTGGIKSDVGAFEMDHVCTRCDTTLNDQNLLGNHRQYFEIDTASKQNSELLPEQQTRYKLEFIETRPGAARGETLHGKGGQPCFEYEEKTEARQTLKNFPRAL